MGSKDLSLGDLKKLKILPNCLKIRSHEEFTCTIRTCSIRLLAKRVGVAFITRLALAPVIPKKSGRAHGICATNVEVTWKGTLAFAGANLVERTFIIAVALELTAMRILAKILTRAHAISVSDLAFGKGSAERR